MNISLKSPKKEKENKTSSKFIADRSISILKKNIQNIKNVNEWSQLTGYSRSWMWKCVKKHYCKTPNTILKEIRYKKIKSVILNNPNAAAKFVASQVAPWSVSRLYNFLNYYYDTNFTDLRIQILSS